jgi:hypothetical protein
MRYLYIDYVYIVHDIFGRGGIYKINTNEGSLAI